MTIELDKLAGPNGGTEGRRLASHWKEQLDLVNENADYKKWVKRGESIEKRYRDERSKTDDDAYRRYSSLWSNVEILTPALYGRMPLPVVERRFKDKDPTGRGAAEMLERGLRNELEVNGFDEAMQQALADYLLPGRGTVWVRYEPEIEDAVSLPPDTQTDMKDAQGEIRGAGGEFDATPPKGRKRLMLNEPEEPDAEGAEPDEEGQEQNDQEETEDKLYETGDRIIRESVPVDYVPWVDFFTFPLRARTWAEVTAVGKRVYMSREQLKKRFGPSVGKGVPLQRDERGHKNQNVALQPSEEDKAQVYEIWSRSDETVYWVAQGYEYLCDRKDDPLTLENFFPCPKPMFANATNTTLVPVPDYIQYQDQAIQIDELTQRISMLTKACKMAGVYNAAAKDIQRLFNESVENQLLPVDDWAAFAEKGGIEGNWSLMPVADIIQVVNQLMAAKNLQIQEMDRLTGITDIMRGTTDARETVGAQRLKSNSSGTRLTRRQGDVARFARDTVRIIADIMAQHFSPQSLINVSGALYEAGLGPEDMPTLTAMQSPPTAPAPPPGPPQGGPMPPPHPLGPPQGAPQGAPGMPPGAPPQPPMGQNVVPFRPPGMPVPAPQPGMPPAGPVGPMGAPPPPIPPEVLAKIAGLKRITAAINLLRDEKLRGFRVDIEVDSTIFPDAAQEKDDRTQFVAAVTQFLQTAMMMGAQMPESVPLLTQLLQFGARGHKIGRSLELAIEEFGEQATIAAKQRQAAAASQPNPEQQKLQLEVQKSQSQLQQQDMQSKTDQMRAGIDLQTEQIKAQSERESSQAEVARQQVENQGEQQNAQSELESKRIDMQMREIEESIARLRLQTDMIKAKRENKEAKHPPAEAS